MSALGSTAQYGKAQMDGSGRIRQATKTMNGTFDAGAVIEDQVRIKEIPIDKLEAQNEVDQNIFEELALTRADFASVTQTIKDLSNPTGKKDGSINAFGIVDTTLSSGTGVLDSSAIASFEVTDAKIAHQKFSFEATQRASHDVMISTQTLTKADTLTNPVVTGGNLSLAFKGKDTMTGGTVLTANLATPVITTNANLILPNSDASADDVTIALDTSMTLETVQKEINQYTSQTGITATLENDDNLGQKLVLTSAGSGQVIDPTGSDASVLTDLGLESNPANLTSSMIDIPLDSTMDYATIVSTINDYSMKTDVQAELVDTGADSFKFALTAQSTGFAIDPSTSTGSITTDLGINGAVTDVSTLQAKVKYKGVEIISAHNQFELIPGLKVDLLKAEANNKFDVTIGPPIQTIADAIETLVENFNKAFLYLTERLNPENEESHMQNVTALKNLSREVANAFGGSLTEFGLKSNTKPTNIGGEAEAYGLVFNKSTFLAKAQSDFNAVKTAFAFNDNKTGDEINLYDKPAYMPTALAGQKFSVKVTETDTSGKATKAEFTILNGATIEATVESGTIKGPTDSDFEGFSFIYYGGELTGGASKTAEFSPTYGTMNKLVTIFDNLFDPDIGTLSAEEKRIKGTPGYTVPSTTPGEKDLYVPHRPGSIEQNAEKIERIRQDIDRFKEREYAKYARSQARISQMEASINFMRVQMGLASAAAT